MKTCKQLAIEWGLTERNINYLCKAGKINGSKKNIDRFRQTYGFGAGTKKMYDYLDENPELMSAPVSYTNDIRSISALDNFMYQQCGGYRLIRTDQL